MQSYSTTDKNNDQKPTRAEFATDRNESKKLRVVLGLFDQPSSLTATFQELIPHGFTAADLCISGSHDTVSMVGSVVQGTHEMNQNLVDLLTHTETYEATADTQTIVGSRGVLFSQLNALIRQNNKTRLSPACKNCNNLTSELRTHIKHGRLVLAVETDEPQQLTHASKVLLRHSPYPIHTHEFRRDAQWRTSTRAR